MSRIFIFIIISAWIVVSCSTLPPLKIKKSAVISLMEGKLDLYNCITSVGNMQIIRNNKKDSLSFELMADFKKKIHELKLNILALPITLTITENKSLLLESINRIINEKSLEK